jgi:hypothetical protein
VGLGLGLGRVLHQHQVVTWGGGKHEDATC